MMVELLITGSLMNAIIQKVLKSNVRGFVNYVGTVDQWRSVHISMMFADAVVTNGRQAINNHHVDSNVTMVSRQSYCSTHIKQFVKQCLFNYLCDICWAIWLIWSIWSHLGMSSTGWLLCGRFGFSRAAIRYLGPHCKVCVKLTFINIL